MLGVEPAGKPYCPNGSSTRRRAFWVSRAVQEEELIVRLLNRLERLEARVTAQSKEEESWVCRELIYDPRDWEIGEEEAIARMKTDELDRLVAAGEIRERDRGRIKWIMNILVSPPEHLPYVPVKATA
jgi:hypothetical protein